jgi:penicillin-binding protein 1A
MNFLKTMRSWIFTHKKLVFIYFPAAVIILSGGYTSYVYYEWTGDKDGALKTLERYKKLIDRTEELKKGYPYHYGDVDLKAKVVDLPTRIYDRNDEVIGEFFEQKREIVPFDFIPRWLTEGVIASEDRDFHEHRGVSPKGIFRAFVTNIVKFRVAQGGSTITQQLAKVLFTDMERSMKRKIYELFCALEIERRYDKKDILSMYLNLIYFGNGAYGVESTAKMYFGKTVREANEAECAMIVATISNPKIYSPLNDLDASVKKTRRILKSLTDAGFIKEKEAEYSYSRFLKKWDVAFDESGKAVSSLIGSFIYSSYRVNRAPFFNELIRRLLVEKFSEDVVKRGGLSIYTTINGQLQDSALAAMRKGILSQREFHLDLSAKMKNADSAAAEKAKAENIEGALVALDPSTGEIIAYVGGYEFTSANQNDNASQSMRQPGSSIKPLVYGAAVQEGYITPSTIIKDEKSVYKGGWSPQNYDGVYSGDVTVRYAVAKSINTVAVKVLDKSGYSAPFDILKKSLDLSGSAMNSRFMETLSFALGAYELSPLENCVIHSVIVNGGDFIKPYGIRTVKDYNGNVVWDFEAEVKTYTEEKRKEYGKIMKPAAAAVTVSMLRSVCEKGGTAYGSVAARNIKYQIAGKTGSTSSYVDAWMVGYTSDLAAAVWIGNKTGSVSLGRGRAGGAIAVPVWAEFMHAAHRDAAPPDFPVPDEGVTSETVCLKSGKVAGRNGECPDTAVQLFLTGTEPGEICDLHPPKENGAQTADKK